MTITRRIDVMYTNSIKDRCQACSEAHYKILDLYLPCPELIQYPCLAKDEYLKSADSSAHLGVIESRITPRSNAFNFDLETVLNTEVNAAKSAAITREPSMLHSPTTKRCLHKEMFSASGHLELKDAVHVGPTPKHVGSMIKDFLRSQVLTKAERKKRRYQEKNWKAGDFRISYDDTTTVISQKRNCI